VNSKDGNESYMVDVNIKVCSCLMGRTGTLCKHISAVEYYYPEKVNLPKVLTASDRYNLQLVAVGKERASSPTFFGISNKSVKFNDPLKKLNTMLTINPAADSIDSNSSERATLASNLGSSALGRNLSQLVDLYSNDPEVLKGVLAMQNTLKKIKNASSLASCLHLFGKNIVGTKTSSRKRKIKVQPTGISRRAAGKPRSSSALRKGAPKRKLKRSHNLNESIHDNIPNAK
jgi:hypothetical protein